MIEDRACAFAQRDPDVSERGERVKGDVGECGLCAREGWVFFGEGAVASFEGAVGGDILVDEQELGFSTPAIGPCEAVLCCVGDEDALELGVSACDRESIRTACVDAYEFEGGL